MILDPVVILAGLTLVAAVGVGFAVVRGLASLPTLRDGGNPEETPPVSIVVAARDEARAVARAVHSLLDQRYPALEVVVVDDRSTDGTGEILDRLAAGRDDLRVIHVDTLPAGWLGKNHALHRGAEAATGELLLFTDADIVMRPEAVARGVAILERHGLDHLAVAPHLRVGSAPARATLTVFLGLFAAAIRPWKARDPNSDAHLGIGAFNLVRARAYRQIGGYRSVAVRPDDDVRLGRALKEAGLRQAVGTGMQMLDVEWYPTLRAMTRGLRKNSFAVVDYRLSGVVAATALPVVFVFWPLAALFLTTGLALWLNVGVVAVNVATYAGVARVHRIPLWTALTYPLGAIFLLWIVWAAALRAVRTGTIEWRGTEYSLDELRG